MATTFNADVSGTGGAIITGDTSGVLQLQGAGTPRLTFNTSGAMGVGSSPDYGSSGQVLTSAGTGAPPTWSSNTGNVTTGKAIVLAMLFGF